MAFHMWKIKMIHTFMNNYYNHAKVLLLYGNQPAECFAWGDPEKNSYTISVTYNKLWFK